MVVYSGAFLSDGGRVCCKVSRINRGKKRFYSGKENGFQGKFHHPEEETYPISPSYGIGSSIQRSDVEVDENCLPLWFVIVVRGRRAILLILSPLLVPLVARPVSPLFDTLLTQFLREAGRLGDVHAVELHPVVRQGVITIVLQRVCGINDVPMVLITGAPGSAVPPNSQWSRCASAGHLSVERVGELLKGGHRAEDKFGIIERKAFLVQGVPNLVGELREHTPDVLERLEPVLQFLPCLIAVCLDVSVRAKSFGS